MVRTQTKKDKIQQKVQSHKLANEGIILKYGSYEELCKQRQIFRTTKDDQYRQAFNDFKCYRKRLKYIENNCDESLSVPTIPQSVSPGVENTEPAESGDAYPTEEKEENNDGEAAVLNVVMTDEECDTVFSNLCCSNCRRKQSRDLVNLYGEIYHIDFQRYVFYWNDNAVLLFVFISLINLLFYIVLKVFHIRYYQK